VPISASLPRLLHFPFQLFRFQLSRVHFPCSISAFPLVSFSASPLPSSPPLQSGERARPACHFSAPSPKSPNPQRPPKHPTCHLRCRGSWQLPNVGARPLLSSSTEERTKVRSRFLFKVGGALAPRLLHLSTLNQQPSTSPSPTGSGPQSQACSTHACKSSSCSHPCALRAPGPFECRSHSPANASPA
jgi:hypothetical protein